MAVATRSSRRAASELVANMANIVTILTAVGVPPLIPAVMSVPPATPVSIVEQMGDVDGLEEFGGLARWRNALLRFPGGRTEPYRIVAMDGRLPSEFKRPLNESRTTYETFVLTSNDTDVAVYDWRDIEEG